MKNILRVVILFIILFSLSEEVLQRNFNPKRRKNSKGCGRLRSSGLVDVFVTVSSLTLAKKGNITERQIEINWHQRKPRKGDKVCLYNKDPQKGAAEPLVSTDPEEHPQGNFRTHVEFPFIFFNLSRVAKSPCLGYWAAYLVGEEVVSSSCLQIRPFWMDKNSRFLKHQKLSRIMIPGSHDSGSFRPYLASSPDTLTKYKYTQEEPIFNQLTYGLRYFDFRVGYYGFTKDKFFINHAVFRTEHSLKTILTQVKIFLEVTKEIVILDFHKFPVGFYSKKEHLEFMKLIYDILNPYLIPHNGEYITATLAKLWKDDKRVMISYNSESRMLDPYGVFWPGLPRAWGNKQRPDNLRIYFERIFTNPLPDTIWVSMAELTPNSKTIVLHPKEGLRRFADEVNKNITRWFRDKFWDKANIVATDYFLGNDMVDVAIEANKMRYFCDKNGYT